jgi:hypothetical protein
MNELLWAPGASFASPPIRDILISCNFEDAVQPL